MLSAVLTAYLAIAILLLLSAMRERPSATDVVVLLLWPVPLAILVAFLLMSWNQPLDA